MVPDSADILIVRIPAVSNNAAKSRGLVLPPLARFQTPYLRFNSEVLA
jgi:hypothetical protein